MDKTLNEVYSMLEDGLDENMVSVKISDVNYVNNKESNLIILLKNGDTKEYVDRIIEQRKNLPLFVDRSPRDMKTATNAIEALKKCKTEEEIVKKLKTLLKYSVDDTFPYRFVSDIIKSLDIYKDNIEGFEYKNEDLTDEILRKIIISETIKSLDNYTIIYPKIKLLMNMIGKESDEVSAEFNLSFTI